jgi:hypothetical protein
MKIRQHRALLTDSMQTVKEIPPTLRALRKHIKKCFNGLPDIKNSKITVTPYGFDQRIGWNTHIVTIEGYGVFGMTDQMVATKKADAIVKKAIKP